MKALVFLAVGAQERHSIGLTDEDADDLGESLEYYLTKGTVMTLAPVGGRVRPVAFNFGKVVWACIGEIQDNKLIT